MSHSPEMSQAHPDIITVYTQPPSELTRELVRAGHMAYRHEIVTDRSGNRVFAKIHDPRRFSDASRESHSRAYLIKEQLIFEHLRSLGFIHVPDHSALINADGTTLLMDGLHPDDGWLWHAPVDGRLDRYIGECLEALRILEPVAIPNETGNVTPTTISLQQEGWSSFTPETYAAVRQNLSGYRAVLYTRTLQWAEDLSDRLEALAALAAANTDITVFCHHDARQANIAWHPDHGVRFVDWSWAGPGRANSDRTTFLIDLAKSGIDVTPYLVTHFNTDHALDMAGFWLRQSIRSSWHGNSDVRFQQALSAVIAYELITKMK